MSILSSLSDILKEAEEIYINHKPSTYEAYEKYGEDEVNKAVQGDCLDYMKYLLEVEDMKGKVNLIYIDPPFLTKAKYDAIVNLPGTSEKMKVSAYSDIWGDDDSNYYRYLAARFFAMRELLSDDGCLWVHLDWHASHYIKIILDEIFGASNFVNEIIWTYKSGGSTKRHFARKHDTLLFYSKTKNYYFKPQKEKSYNRGLRPYNFKGVEEFEDETGWYTLVNMKDVWNIDMVGRTSKERNGYATQKPESLIERIIESCSREGDICADFFAGSGTLASCAGKMKRKFLSCDMEKLALEMTVKRLCKNGEAFEVISKKDEKTEKNFKKYDEISASSDIINISAFIDLNEGTSHAVDMWSIDPDFNGNVHRPVEVFIRDKNKIDKETELSLGRKFSIVSYDILGNRMQYVYIRK